MLSLLLLPLLLSWSVSVAGGQCVEMEGLDWGWELTPGDTVRRQARGLEACQRLCVYWTPCLTSSFHPASHLCLLSPHPPKPVPSTWTDDQAPLVSVLRNSTQCQGQAREPCATKPCDVKETCAPVMQSKGHVCLPLVDETKTSNTPTTNETASASTTNNSTTESEEPATISNADGPTTDDGSTNSPTNTSTTGIQMTYTSTTDALTTTSITSSPTTTDAPSCPSGTDLLGSSIRYCVDTNMIRNVTMTTAVKRCFQKGLRMLVADSEEKMNLIRRVFSGNGNRIWLYGKTETAGNWFWLHNNASFTYTDWNKDFNEPGNTRDVNCVAMNQVANLKWHDYLCESSYDAVCEADL